MLEISTAGVLECERLEYWQEIASRLFLELRTEQVGKGPFFGRLRCNQVSQLPVVHLHSSPQIVARGKTEISTSSGERYFVCMQLSGRCRVRQGRLEAVSEPGDIELINGDIPTDIAFDSDYRRIVIPVARHALAPRLLDPYRMTMMVLPKNHSMADLVGAYFRAFARSKLTDRQAGPVSEILLDLIALAFNSLKHEAQAPQPCVREALRVKICSYIEQHLSDSTLSPPLLAKQFRISVRYLHKLFSDEGETVMGWVLKKRLQHCHADLANPLMQKRTILDIALSWGFCDLSHFGRAFKSYFGVSPGEFRTNSKLAAVRDMAL